MYIYTHACVLWNTRWFCGVVGGGKHTLVFCFCAFFFWSTETLPDHALCLVPRNFPKPLPTATARPVPSFVYGGSRVAAGSKHLMAAAAPHRSKLLPDQSLIENWKLLIPWECKGSLSQIFGLKCSTALEWKVRSVFWPTEMPQLTPG